MKKCATLFALLIFSSNIFAGTGGPDLFGYTWKDSDEPDGPAYNWIDILALPNVTQVKLLGDDNSRGPFYMNFDFHYYWYDVDQFYVGSNGYTLFQQGQLASPFYDLPTTNDPNNIIGAFMNDITFAGTGNTAECWYWINPDYDTLIVSWIGVPFWMGTLPYYTGSNTFQIILSAVDSSITFQYAEQTGTGYGGNTKIGIENYSGSVGLSWNTVFPNYMNPPINYAIKFYYPQNPTLQITDAAVQYNDNVTTGGIFLPVSSTSHSLTAEIKNWGTSTTSPFGVNAIVKNPSGVNVVNITDNTDTMASLQSQVMTFSSSMQPTTAGTYQFITTSQLTGDNVSSNNSKTQEIVAIDTSQTEMELGYDNGEIPFFGLGWIGGYGCIADYFIPPFYPVAITKLHYWNTTIYNQSTFAARVLDDDGAQGLPFTLYDSIYVDPSDVVLNGWTDLTLTEPIIVNSGGVYVTWDMKGENIFLGMATLPPLSYRSFEAGHDDWGTFRFSQYYDPLINITIEKYSYPTGISINDNQFLQLQLFPNPCSGTVNLVYSIPENQRSNMIVIFDVRGKEIKEIDLGAGAGMHQLNLDISELDNGIYFAELVSGNRKAMQKMVVVN
ncbi:MAG TPA: T9SS type A sorting domain-containing protein [Chitinophagales bacterium]|nr:T9SS type A sorting domain-containing protein [Chitinophagales bacterium]